MSRQTVTITITARNGIKVRTVASKRYFVVRSHTITQKWNSQTQAWVAQEPEPCAKVIKRTDNLATAQTEKRLRGGDIYMLTYVDGKLSAVRY